MFFFKIVVAILLMLSLSAQATALCQDMFVMKAKGSLKVTLEKGIILTESKGTVSLNDQVGKGEKLTELHLDEEAMEKLESGETLSNEHIAVKLDGGQLIITSTERGSTVLRVIDFDREVSDVIQGKMTIKTKIDFRSNNGKFSITGSDVENSYDGTIKEKVTVALNEREAEYGDITVVEGPILVIASKRFTPSDSGNQVAKKERARLLLEEEGVEKLERGETLSSGFIAIKFDENGFTITDTERQGTEPLFIVGMGR